MLSNLPLIFTLNSPPFSINKAYYKHSHTRTAECRAWGDRILTQLQNTALQRQFAAFRAFDDSMYGIALTLEFHTPRMYKKDGKLNRLASDLSNVEKMLIDLLFDPRHNGRLVDDIPIHNLNLDDKLIIKLTSLKMPSSTNRIVVTLDLLPLPEFPQPLS